jgi:motility quorum-sensing regulator / GCU-specific mRNA interferase toxin
VEKRKPTYDLEAFKLVGGDARRLAMTVSAARSARSLGLDRIEIAAVVRSMRAEHFYKSMTSYGNYRQ